LPPQQYAVPTDVTAHALYPPTVTLEKVRPPLTSVGTDRLVDVPSPSWPYPLYPQQYAAPAVVSARLLVRPLAIALNTWPVDTAVGNERLVVVPSPICP